jgi:tetratricopeptide (TPR) repeat protein
MMPLKGKRVRRVWLGAGILLMSLGMLGAAQVAAQEPVPEDSSVQIFTVMAAINAAGYEADLDSPHNSPVRRQVREHIAAVNPPSLAALREFYRAHRQSNAARDLSQFISLALLIGAPPEFQFRVKEPELPLEVSALRDMLPLLSAFYREAGIQQLWEKHHPAYEQELDRYNQGMAEVMQQVTGYLRIGSTAYLGRNFGLYVDLLGAPGQANARSFGPDYYVVVSASPVLQLDEVRHGYLHYILDPMARRYPGLIQSKADLRDFAELAHALDPVLRKDFRLLLGESLIRAVELRLARIPEPARQQRLRDTLAEGHILAPHFYEALQKYEKQDAGMRIYYPDLIEAINVRQEQRRLARVTFREAPEAGSSHVVALSPAPGGPAAAGPGSRPGRSGETPGADKPSQEEEALLSQGEDALARQDFAAARQAFQAVLDRRGSMQDQAMYFLALVATQERQPEIAKTYFQQALEITRDAHVRAWANIYLGRIFDMEQNRELAVRHYQQALESGATEPATRLAAERGLQAPFRVDARN